MAAIAAVLAGAAAVQPAAPQAPAAATTVDVSECVSLTTPEERLACFEKQVEVAKTNPPPPPASSGGRDEPPPADIQGRIAELRETVPDAWLITLDNGQVWRQTVPKIYPLQAGTPVRIYYSRWRSYRLTNDALKSFIQVERVR
jgi:hypothetical protein